MKMCEFNVAKPCYGLCNNCPLKASPEERNKGFDVFIMPRQSRHHGDYEELILARQEMDD